MTQKDDALRILKQYNAWRRDKGDTENLVMPNPKEIGEAIDFAIKALSEPETVTLPDGWVADAKRIDWINREIISIDTFQMCESESFGWVFSQYYLGEKEPREIYKSYIEDFRKSIDAAMLASEPTLNEKS